MINASEFNIIKQLNEEQIELLVATTNNPNFRPTGLSIMPLGLFFGLFYLFRAFGDNNSSTILEEPL